MKLPANIGQKKTKAIEQLLNEFNIGKVGMFLFYSICFDSIYLIFGYITIFLYLLQVYLILIHQFNIN